MSGKRLHSILAGEADGYATALMWVAKPALLGVTDLHSEKDALLAFADAMRPDGVLVDSRAEWAPAAASALHDRGIAVLWAVDGVLARVAEKCGWSAALKMTADPSLGGEFSLAAADVEREVAALGGADADVLLIADDLAGDEWLVPPEAAAATVELCGEAVRRWAGPAAFHSDGDIRAVLPAIAGAGFSAVHFGRLGEVAVQACFEVAWDTGLVPMGGIVTSEPADTLRLGRLAALIARGPCVLADDGGAASPAEAKRLIDAVATIRATGI